MGSVDFFIENGFVLTMGPGDEIYPEGSVAVKDGVIVDVGPSEKLSGLYEARRVIDAANSVVMPGLIDTYAHAGHPMIKGIFHPFRGWPARDLFYFNATTEEFWRADGFLGAVDRLKFGTTTGVSIIGATPARVDDPAFAGAHGEAVEEVGVRGVIGVGPPDVFLPSQNRLESMVWDGGEARRHTFTYEEVLENCVEVIERWHEKAEGRIHVSLAYPYICGRLPSHSKVGARYSYKDEDVPVLLEKSLEMRRLADRYGVQIHSHLYGGALEFGLEKFGKENLYEILGPDVVLAHCNGLTGHEIEILSETDTKVATAPSATEPIYFGRCPIPELIEAGVCVATSTDGAAPNMSFDLFISVRNELLIQKYHFQDPCYMPAGKALKMITIDAARVLGLDSQIGSLEKGKKADIILIDTFKAHFTPSLMIPQLLVYYGSGHDVKTVMVDGKILMEDRVVKTVDETKVIEEAREEIENAFHRFKQLGYPMERYTETGEDFWKGPKQHDTPYKK